MTETCSIPMVHFSQPQPGIGLFTAMVFWCGYMYENIQHYSKKDTWKRFFFKITIIADFIDRVRHWSIILLFFPIVIWVRWSFVIKVIDKLSTRILWTIPPTFMKNDKQEIMKFLLVWRDIDASISLIPATNNFFYWIYLSLMFRFNESQAIACICLSF